MSECRGMLSVWIILLHDNVRPHTVDMVRDKLQKFGWETSSVNPRSFPLCLPHFCRPEEIHSWMSVSFGQGSARVGEVVDPSATYSFYKTGIDRLVSQWDKCINTSGNYFWIKQIPLLPYSGSRIRWSSGYHTRLWIRGSQVRSWPGSIFSEHKNPEYDFLRKGSKAMGAVS